VVKDETPAIWTTLVHDFGADTVQIVCSCGQWKSRKYRPTNKPEVVDEQQYVEDAHLSAHTANGQKVIPIHGL
jgi:hypothetical protein